MKNNTMIPYNPKKDLETNYYNKTEVELLVAGGSGGSIDLSNYYKKLETYSKAQVDALIAGGGADLSDYYTKAEVESLISALPETDLSNYYDKTQVDSLIPDISTKQDVLVSATNIKTINGESILGSGDLVISGGGSGGNVDLSEYYKKTETYSKIEVDTKIDDIPETDLSGYYNKTQVDNIIADIPPTDLSNYYDKTETYSKVEVDTKISDIPATDLSNYYNKSQVDTIALDKVDKVAGKQLSTEDYTTADKNKLTGLSNYTKPASEPISYITGLQTALDSKVSKTGVEALHSTDALRISGTTLSLYKGDGTFESVVTQDTVYTLPKASATVLGGIKVGTNLSIDSNGVLSANDTNVSFTEISNKPTNLSGYGITDVYTKTQVDSLLPDISTKQENLVSGANIKTINGESILGSGDIVISSGGTVDLSEYYKKTETYNKIEVDTIISNIPETDLTNYYNKTEVDSLIDVIPEADLTNYYNKTQVDAIALDKVDKVVGKQLSTEDYTTAEKTKLSGLSNYVKPTSEPISYIDGLQTALGDKVDKVSKQALDSNNALRVTGTTVSLYKGDGTFDSITTQDTIYTLPTATSTVKGGIEIFSDTVQTITANAVSTTSGRTYGIQLNSAGQAVVNVPWSDTNTVYTLPTASATVLGGIKVGANLSIDANGVLSASGGGGSSSWDSISNKPTTIGGYGITDAYTKTEVDTMVGDIASALDTINGQVI